VRDSDKMEKWYLDTIAMLLVSASAGLCGDKKVSVDPSEDPNGLPWLWGEVLAMGDEAAGMIDW